MAGSPIVSRATDVVLAFPFLIPAVGLAAIVGPSPVNATIALAVSQVPVFIRIARGEVLALREQEYVQAAIVNSAPTRVIMVRHILPKHSQPAYRAGDGWGICSTNGVPKNFAVTGYSLNADR